MTDKWEQASFKHRATPDWFIQAKLGFFIHWGVYSLPAWAEPTAELGTVEDDNEWFTHNPYAEWYYNTIRIDGSPAQKHHQEHWDNVPYEELLDRWTFNQPFNAKPLVTQLAKAGGGYLLLTTKHHDGVALWDAPGTNGYNTVHRGPKQDLVKAYYDACEQVPDIKFGVYYSGGLDWDHSPFPPHLSQESVLEKDRPIDETYAKYAASHIRDLIANYKPYVIWDDINYPDDGKGFEPYGLGTLFAEYYEAQPEGVVNDRFRVPHADYVTSEYQMDLDNHSLDHVWENCRGMGLSFGYNQAEGPEHALSAQEIMVTICRFACRNGRLMLGITPKADGSLPAWQTDILETLARWMAVAKPYVESVQKPGPAITVTANNDPSHAVWSTSGLVVKPTGSHEEVVSFIDPQDGINQDNASTRQLQIAVPARNAALSVPVQPGVTAQKQEDSTVEIDVDLTLCTGPIIVTWVNT